MLYPTFAGVFGPGPVASSGSRTREPLGEHNDYNHGFVLPVAIDRDILLCPPRRIAASICTTQSRCSRHAPLL